ncbi:histidine kinase N-terminal domain-containing protein [Pseudalkalibacillus caeni]|uniref:histidine kinase n=1 Tax=Exobacillus caeni TaxID=2574798 RepID=A0A5R9F684_9BACL|nr:histidine kinase N-terminal domain-containing protein [Pseudalkalibacillus caeni]TLS37856.1 GHKL domain-containing protein [Pseudalkalibacillus caeni]
MSNKLTKEQADKLATHLERNQDKIVERWLEIARLAATDPFLEEIILNGKRTVGLIADYIRKPDHHLIINLTRKIATERVEADVNIGEFVANINQGRSVVMELAIDSILSREEVAGAVPLINSYFDQFLYYSVTEYTEIKDRILQEKNQFIKEMHNDRLAILGKLAPSFAHEFRNPLTSIKGFLRLIEQADGSRNNRQYFSIINQEMESLQDKVSHFLYLSKLKGLDDKGDLFNLSASIRHSIDFLFTRFVEEQIEVLEKIEPDVYIFGVENQIKQVFLNIVINSIEELANNNRDNRKIWIDLSESDKTVILKISNNGSQIPGHLLENIFEPFITTKELGTGLGLSVCKQIIQKHNGTISVESNNETTAFEILVDKSSVEKLKYEAK